MIVKGGPSERRRYLDMQLSQLNPRYFYSLQKYVHSLSQRNALLHAISFNPSLEKTVYLWDEQLAESGEIISLYRREAIEKLSECASQEHSDLTDGKEALKLRYISDTADTENIKETILSRLEANREDDIRRGNTSFGIHRDDISISINGKDSRNYASQGQQRTAVLSLKLAQAVFYEQVKREKPVLMLDDVMSELDPERRRKLIERIDQIQTFVTCTDISDLAGSKKGVFMRFIPVV